MTAPRARSRACLRVRFVDNSRRELSKSREYLQPSLSGDVCVLQDEFGRGDEHGTNDSRFFREFE